MVCRYCNHLLGPFIVKSFLKRKTLVCNNSPLEKQTMEALMKKAVKLNVNVQGVTKADLTGKILVTCKSCGHPFDLFNNDLFLKTENLVCESCPKVPIGGLAPFVSYQQAMELARLVRKDSPKVLLAGISMEQRQQMLEQKAEELNVTVLKTTELLAESKVIYRCKLHPEKERQTKFKDFLKMTFPRC